MNVAFYLGYRMGEHAWRLEYTLGRHLIRRSTCKICSDKDWLIYLLSMTLLFPIILKLKEML